MAEALMEIGELARRSGVAVSALRFYEARGLIEALRSPGNRRRFPRSALRKVALIRAAQAVGLSLDAVQSALDDLPQGRAPTRADWQALSSNWANLLDQRIAAMVQLRQALGACIGCGCLSLDTCALYNAGDHARLLGSGPRFLMGDDPAGLSATSPAGEASDM